VLNPQADVKFFRRDQHFFDGECGDLSGQLCGRISGAQSACFSILFSKESAAAWRGIRDQR
jgi:hypothetical protein